LFQLEARGPNFATRIFAAQVIMKSSSERGALFTLQGRVS
jgi:hypothetical protein